MTMKNAAWWWVPAAMLAVGVLPMPYGYYRVLRVVVCVAAAVMAYAEWNRHQQVRAWAVAFVALALLFNPLVPVHLSKAAWGWIDAAAAAVFVGHWWLRGR